MVNTQGLDTFSGESPPEVRRLVCFRVLNGG